MKFGEILLLNLIEQWAKYSTADLLVDKAAAEGTKLLCIPVLTGLVDIGINPVDQILNPHICHIHKEQVGHNVVHMDYRGACSLVELPLGHQLAPDPALLHAVQLVEITPDLGADIHPR